MFRTYNFFVLYTQKNAWQTLAKLGENLRHSNWVTDGVSDDFKRKQKQHWERLYIPWPSFQKYKSDYCLSRSDQDLLLWSEIVAVSCFLSLFRLDVKLSMFILHFKLSNTDSGDHDIYTNSGLATVSLVKPKESKYWDYFSDALRLDQLCSVNGLAMVLHWLSTLLILNVLSWVAWRLAE